MRKSRITTNKGILAPRTPRSGHLATYQASLATAALAWIPIIKNQLLSWTERGRSALIQNRQPVEENVSPAQQDTMEL